ncbi:Uncharacterized MFS-type transporter C09D4.1 [Camponotus floridanus]|uniref:Uncharacterized MFS-type transporter C09D4.1 n=1 Tax=Camponotus floridanus TaxID=104421 RepID=E2AQW9_CAMFO|nr:Uncharacterized MFS-type transporter C09D4.1 [Camponotus floridanus]
MEDTNLNEVLTIKNSVKIVKLGEQSNIEPFKLKKYKKRWIILIIFLIFNAAGTYQWIKYSIIIIANGGGTYQWIKYSIITNIIARYYGVSSLMVGWTAMMFMLLYVIFVLPVQYVSDKCGLRWTIILSSGLICLGSWIKIFSIHPDNFYIAFIGQAIVGFSQSLTIPTPGRLAAQWFPSIVGFTQTLTLPIPGRLAAQWFPSNELSIATCLGVFGNQMGIALSFLLTPIIVKNHENLDDIGNDLSSLCCALVIITTIAFILVLIFFQEEPKLPPSESRALQKFNRTKNVEELIGPIKRLYKNKNFNMLCNSHGLSIGVLNAVAMLLNQIFLAHFEEEPKLPPSESRALQKFNRTKNEEEFVGPIKRLCKNKNFIMLCNSHGLSIGVLNVVATLLNQIFLTHFENGEEDAGRIGLCMIISGTIGAVVLGIILDKTHKFKETAVTVYFLSLCGLVLFSVFIYCGIKWMVYVSSILLGFFMSGYFALGYELCTEYTYPESENLTAGILNIANNLYGMIFVSVSNVRLLLIYLSFVAFYHVRFL